MQMFLQKAVNGQVKQLVLEALDPDCHRRR
jgi:hypothetical protein